MSSFLKRLLFLGLPLSAQALVEYVFMFTDLAFVGQADPAGLSLVNTVMTPFAALQAFYIALILGVTVLLAKAEGRGHHLLARRLGENAFFFASLVSLGFLLFWLILGPLVLDAMGLPLRQRDQGILFLRLLCPQFLTLGLGSAAAALLQAKARAVPIMVAALVKCLLNLVLDWLLIFGELGFPELGVPGAALASSLSSITGDLFLLFVALREKEFRPRLRKIARPNPKLTGGLLALGLPLGLEYVIWELGRTGIVAMVNRVDDSSSGLFAVANVLVSLSVQFYLGLGSAVLILAGQTSGSGDARIVKKFLYPAVFFAFGICLLAGTAILSFSEEILGVFLKETGLKASLLPLLPLVCLGMFPKAYNIMAGRALRGLGKVREMMLTQIICTCFTLVLGLGLLHGLGLGLFGLLLCVLLDEAMRAFWNFRLLREPVQRIPVPAAD